MLIYPWEPFLGATNFLVVKHGNMIHKHKFTPRKIKKLAKNLANCGLRHRYSTLYYAVFPMYITVFTKR